MGDDQATVVPFFCPVCAAKENPQPTAPPPPPMMAPTRPSEEPHPTFNLKKKIQEKREEEKRFRPAPSAPAPSAPPPAPIRMPSAIRPSRDAIRRGYEEYLDDVMQAYQAADEPSAEEARGIAEEKGSSLRRQIEEHKQAALPNDPDIQMDLRQSLQSFLIEFHWFILFHERTAFSAASDVRASKIAVLNRAKRDFNAFLTEFESKFGGPISIKLVKLAPTPLPRE